MQNASSATGKPTACLCCPSLVNETWHRVPSLHTCCSMQGKGGVKRAVRTIAATSWSQEGANRSSECSVSSGKAGQDEGSASGEDVSKSKGVYLFELWWAGVAPLYPTGPGPQPRCNGRALSKALQSKRRTPLLAPRRLQRPRAPHSSSSASSFRKPVRCSRLFCPMMWSIVGVSTTSLGSCTAGAGAERAQHAGWVGASGAGTACWLGGGQQSRHSILAGCWQAGMPDATEQAGGPGNTAQAGVGNAARDAARHVAPTGSPPPCLPLHIAKLPQHRARRVRLGHACPAGPCLGQRLLQLDSCVVPLRGSMGQQHFRDSQQAAAAPAA